MESGNVDGGALSQRLVLARGDLLQYLDMFNSLVYLLRTSTLIFICLLFLLKFEPDRNHFSNRFSIP